MQKIKDDVLISVRNITTQIGSNVIHKDLSLEIKRGDSLAIIGGSGAGKSVLLQAILGLRPPVKGEVIAFGHSVYSSKESELNAIRKRWGVLFQGGALFSSQTVNENIKTPIKEYTKLSERFLQAYCHRHKSLGFGIRPPWEHENFRDTIL